MPDGEQPDGEQQPVRPAEIRRVLDRLGVAPFKGWGQHFLTDPAVPRAMAELAGVGPGDTVVEIGPGLGVLTAPLLATGATVIAVEVDPRLAVYLRERLGDRERFRLVEGDILKLSPAEIVPPGRGYQVVANLPYSITSAVLRHLLERADRPSQVVVMVQEEVARRIVARPPAMSLLAVSVQLYGTPRLALRVPAGSFSPRPKVDSAVVALPVAPPPLSLAEQPGFFRLVAAGFGQRRKMLANALQAGLDRPAPEIAAALVAAEIDPRRRAETLSVADWLRLDRTLRAMPAVDARGGA